MATAPAARELDGKAALVTGSVRGIGRAVALALAEAGAAVVVNGRRSAEAAREVADRIEAEGGRALVHLADVSAPNGAEGAVAAAVDAFGRLDVLVNNVAHRIAKPVEETSFAEWRDVQASTLDCASPPRSRTSRRPAAGRSSISAACPAMPGCATARRWRPPRPGSPA